MTKYTYRNQAQEILDYIKNNPGTSTEGIVSGTGWNRHLVEVTTKLMVEQGLIKEMGQTDWLGFKYEAIDKSDKLLGSIPKTKTIKQLSEEIDRIIENINLDLQASNLKVFPFQKVAVATGLSAISVPGLTSMINESIEQNKLVEEIAAITRKTTEEVIEIYQSHPYSLQTIKSMAMMGNKLGGNMDYGVYQNWESLVGRENMEMRNEQHTFIVILPNNDRREVKAHCMEVDGATLYFEDDNHDTILAYAPGSWLWAERQQDNR